MKDQRGFTLIELILVIILLGIIAGTFAAGLVPTMQASVMVDNRKEAIQGARMAMDRMVKEIRLIRSATGRNPDPGDIELCDVDDLKFSDAYDKWIEFKLSGSSLLRNTDTLSSNVQSLSFTYFDKGGFTVGPVSDPALCTDAVATNIWRIRINLQVQVGNETVVLQSEVNPGNFT